jgi:hypothetical protein
MRGWFDYHTQPLGAGGPIIEREGISVATDDVEPWCGFIEDDETTLYFLVARPHSSQPCGVMSPAQMGR